MLETASQTLASVRCVVLSMQTCESKGARLRWGFVEKSPISLAGDLVLECTNGSLAKDVPGYSDGVWGGHRQTARGSL